MKSPGLSTLASNLIEVSRSNGAGEYRGPSPEGPGGQKKFQNTQGGGRTLEHPLVNGCSALKTSDEEKQNEVSYKSYTYIVLYMYMYICVNCVYCMTLYCIGLCTMEGTFKLGG